MKQYDIFGNIIESDENDQKIKELKEEIEKLKSKLKQKKNELLKLQK